MYAGQESFGTGTDRHDNSGLVLSLIDGMDWPIAALSVDGEIRFANTAFRGLKAGHSGVIAGNRLAFSSAEANRQLRELLANIRVAPAAPRHGRLHLTFGDDVPALQIDYKYAPPSGHVSLLVRSLEPVRTGTQTRRILQESYGLTAAEADCACRLADGASGHVIAAERNVSFETVRCQLRTVRRKLNVKSAGEAIARVLAFGERNPLPKAA